jgi:hypothetical protein
MTAKMPAKTESRISGSLARRMSDMTFMAQPGAAAKDALDGAYHSSYFLND